MPEMFQYIHRGLTQSAVNEKVIVSGFWVEDSHYIIVLQDSEGDVIDLSLTELAENIS